MRSIVPFLALAARVTFVCAEQAPLLPQLPSDAVAGELALPQTSSDELLYLHRKLIQIESITENEKDVGDWLAGYLEKNGLTVEKQEVAKKRYNIIAYPGKKKKTKVLVTSHIDTVGIYISWSQL
jgi:acetylornithine deacetylase